MERLSTNLDPQISAAASALRDAGAKAVYVFGSQSNGRSTDSSDIDLAVSGLPANVFYHACAKAQSVASVLIDVVDLDADTPFTRYLLSKGSLRRVA